VTIKEFLDDWQSDSPTLLVHTSGSTGKPKPLLVEKRRMEASARMTCSFLGLHEGDTALLCMPLDYIAGKMMVVRALTCGLQLVAVPPSGLPCWEGAVDFAAMVPLQVWNLLHDEQGRKRLMQIRNLIIGGGAIDESLARALKDFPNAVWSTYGMTETLSHIALRRLNGPEATEWYTPFKGVNVSLTADNCLTIVFPAVSEQPLATNDIAVVEKGRFRILGRKDNVVCSGGLKIQIEEVERLLREHARSPYIITKRSDPKFGEALVMLTEGNVDEAMTLCRQWLPKHWQPRYCLHVDRIPMTETGKPARQQAAVIARDGLPH
jgi:O-succinylbenzoic acid--CoA ligase